MPTANDLLNAVLTGLGIGGLFAVDRPGVVPGVRCDAADEPRPRRVHRPRRLHRVLPGAPRSVSIRWSATLIAAPAVALLAYPLQHYALSPVMSRGAEAPLLITFGVSVVLQNVFIVAFSAGRAFAERGVRVGQHQAAAASRCPSSTSSASWSPSSCWAPPTWSSRAPASAAACVPAPRTPSPRRSWASTSSACTP